MRYINNFIDYIQIYTNMDLGFVGNKIGAH